MDKLEIKMRLLKEFGICDMRQTVDFCREAYRFLIEDDEPSPAKAPDPVPARDGCVPAAVTAVDLGLPSGRLWADRNVGARCPEDYGAFFSWGNVEPHFPDRKDMDWGNAEGAFDYDFSWEEYKKTPGYLLEGDIDIVHDAARVNMGEPWRMPTAADFQELYDNCAWYRKTGYGVNGYLVISKINGNRVFFPCSGNGDGTSWSLRGSYGYYWSSSLLSAGNGRALLFSSGGVFPQYYYDRFVGFALRPVQ